MNLIPTLKNFSTFDLLGMSNRHLNIEV